MNTNTCQIGQIEGRLLIDVVSCSRHCQQLHQLVLYLRHDEVHKISFFKEYTFVCPLWKFHIFNPSVSLEFQFKDPPPSPPPPLGLGIPTNCLWYVMDIFWNRPMKTSYCFQFTILGGVWQKTFICAKISVVSLSRKPTISNNIKLHIVLFVILLK